MTDERPEVAKSTAFVDDVKDKMTRMMDLLEQYGEMNDQLQSDCWRLAKILMQVRELIERTLPHYDGTYVFTKERRELMLTLLRSFELVQQEESKNEQ